MKTPSAERQHDTNVKVINTAAARGRRVHLPSVSACATHRRRFESLSRLSHAKQGKHFRSDPVRVQSTHYAKLLEIPSAQDSAALHFYALVLDQEIQADLGSNVTELP